MRMCEVQGNTFIFFDVTPYQRRIYVFNMPRPGIEPGALGLQVRSATD